MEQARESQAMLEIRDLHVSVQGHEILRGVDLTAEAGEIHAVMGPNGSGKSTLAQVLAGHPAYRVTSGQVAYMGRDLLEMPPEERAREGVFLPVSARSPGVNNAYFLRAGLNEIRSHRGGEIDAADTSSSQAKSSSSSRWTELPLPPGQRGLLRGEKSATRSCRWRPRARLAILDETDSGLDIDALRVVATRVDSLRRPDNATILVTHYQRLLNYITPDFVHVLHAGRIVKSGGKELALELEERGYDWLRETEQNASA
jgi:Fe-S cluster assembly ATP-binding protein